MVNWLEYFAWVAASLNIGLFAGIAWTEYAGWLVALCFAVLWARGKLKPVAVSRVTQNFIVNSSADAYRRAMSRNR